MRDSGISTFKFDGNDFNAHRWYTYASRDAGCMDDVVCV